MKTKLIFLLVITASAYNSVRLYNYASYSIDFLYNKCFYNSSLSNFDVSITVKGMCPYSITYYPESNTWHR